MNIICDLKLTNSHLALSAINRKRVLILDGGIGTQIQTFKLKGKHFNFARFKGNNEMLNILQPKVIEKIHYDYAKAGSDVLSTNTFGANSLCQSDYNSARQCEKLNQYASLIAKRAAIRAAFEMERRIFVAGVLGPTNKSSAIPIDTSQPERRGVTFDELYTSYKLQIRTMAKCKVDIVLVETVFDALNAKAAIAAYLDECNNSKVKLPIVISATISDSSGRILSGQTLEAFWASVKHAKPFAMGLNCSLGANQISKHAKVLSKASGGLVWVYPNAGLPNTAGDYIETTFDFACKVNDIAEVVGAIGGCCGSTARHIEGLKALNLKTTFRGKQNQRCLKLSGTELLQIARNKFYKVGERANVSGSSSFKRAIMNKKYIEALEVVREQLSNGAHIIDLNMDDALINSNEELKRFIGLIGSEPDLAKMPLMIDSSDWRTLHEALKLIQGRSLVNSISLKEGNDVFVNKAKVIKTLGAIPIVIAFDEAGQATTIERRLKICKRAHNLLTKVVGFEREEIIFDLNTFAIATGIPEHDENAINLLKSIDIIKCIFPFANIIAGVSNLSFSFRGNNKIRNALHKVFLENAIKFGLNLAIVNPRSLKDEQTLSDKQTEMCRRLVFNIKSVELDDILLAFKTCNNKTSKITPNLWRTWPLDAKVKHAVVIGVERYIEEDVLSLAIKIGAINVIETALMEGMNTVGKLFGSGKMFLPQVIKSSRVMKRAVIVLESLMERKFTANAPIIVLATVKGDVHDIGKNIVATVLSCNNYKIIDLGIMVHSQRIVKISQEMKASIIGLSGLISPSLDEMAQVARRLEASGCKIPLIVGGATTSKLHTALKLRPEYPSGIVVHVADASKAVEVVNKLTSKHSKRYIEAIKLEYETIALIHNKLKTNKNIIKFDERITHRNLTNPRKFGNLSMIGLKLSAFSAKEISFRDVFVQSASIGIAKSLSIMGKIWKTLTSERWISIRRQVGIMNAFASRNNVAFANSKGRKLGNISFIRQQHGSCLSLSDFISGNDHIGIYCCAVGPEGSLIQQFLKKTDKLRDALALKILCDKSAETCSQISSDCIKLDLMKFVRGPSCSKGRRGLNSAPGYPIWPDHTSKLKLSKIINGNEATGLIVTNRWALTPQSSVIALITSDPRGRYFGVSQITNDQLKDLAKANKISKKLLENLLSTIIDKL
ncbi:MAG: homocysteine S-methyltransferase family protein [Candidatus Hodgkinia cicadicola]